MLKTGGFNLPSGGSPKINVDRRDYRLFCVEKYEKYHAFHGGEEEDRKANYDDMVNTYYNLVERFYHAGWGESSHFAHRCNGESLRESMKRHERFIALQLGLKPGQKVLDVGCGMGGPLREIAKYSLASMTGLDNNAVQILRAKIENHFNGVDKTIRCIKADFMKMPLSNNSFDAVYAIEATCHAPDALGCYKEIYRVLKPGQCFAAYERCMTGAFNPNNQEHQKIKAKIEIGCAIPDVRLTTKSLEALEQAGFEVIWEKDLAVDSLVPWYLPLDEKIFSDDDFRRTAVGRSIYRNMVKALEYVGVFPKGSGRVQDLLEKAVEGLVEGGRREIFTPMYFFLARKPHDRGPLRTEAPKKVIARPEASKKVIARPEAPKKVIAGPEDSKKVIASLESPKVIRRPVTRSQMRMKN